MERRAKLHKRSWKRDEAAINGNLFEMEESATPRHQPYVANRTLALLRTMFNVGHRWGLSVGRCKRQCNSDPGLERTPMTGHIDGAELYQVGHFYFSLSD
jgi:hypothetical protein